MASFVSFKIMEGNIQINIDVSQEGNQSVKAKTRKRKTNKSNGVNKTKKPAIIEIEQLNTPKRKTRPKR